MADPRKPGRLARTQGALWYGSRSYRLSWLALAAAAVAAFFMGGGVGDLGFGAVGFGGGAGGRAPLQTTGEWASPMDVTATEDTLNKLQDKAGGEDDAAALAELEAIAKGGDPIASFKLGTLYSPYFADMFPYQARKDALRAVALFEPAAKDGFHKAYGDLAEIYAQEPAPILSLSKACQNFRAYVDAPERQAQGWSTGEISRMVNSANCFLNELRDPGVAYVAPKPEDAAKAMALLAVPILAGDSLAQWSRIKYLNRSGASLTERNSACPVIDSYLALTTPQTRQPGDNCMLSSQALCKLGQYQDPVPTPTKAVQDEALAILTLPELRDDVSALANLAWVYLQPWDIRDPAKACQAVERWVAQWRLYDRPDQPVRHRRSAHQPNRGDQTL